MPIVSNRELLVAIDEASRELANASASNWSLPDGTSAVARLERLASQLQTMRDQAATGNDVDCSGVVDLVRWVTDWIPDVNHPLVHAIGDIGRARGCRDL
jgi:hypothetical protein